MPAVTLESLAVYLAVALFVATQALLFTIATFLLLKALLLERRSALGRALGRNNLAMSLAYYTAFFGTWIPVLRSPLWRAVVIAMTFATALGAIRQFVKTYGGWRAIAIEAGEAAREIAGEVHDNIANKCRLIVRFLNSFRRDYYVSRLVFVLLGVLVVLVALVVLAEF